MKNISGSVAMLVPSNMVHVKGLLSNSKLLSRSLLNMPYCSEPIERKEKSITKAIVFVLLVMYITFYLYHMTQRNGYFSYQKIIFVIVS